MGRLLKLKYMARLFVSYRRSDTGRFADALTERLSAFQMNAVFEDREDIALGANFADEIRSALSDCQAMLVLISNSWLAPAQGGQQSRLFDRADWVRREIEMALTMRVRLVPVLFDRTPMPAPGQLPASIRSLVQFNGFELSTEQLDADLDTLASRIEEMLVRQSARPPAFPGSSRDPVLTQLFTTWLTLGLITPVTALTHTLPENFYWFPGAMAFAAFNWWMYRRAVLVQWHARDAS